jgi:ATP-dependent protease ClpP protease subunit
LVRRRITAKGVAAQLRAIGDRPVEVQINSPGGDMFEGFAIYNVLREHPQAITVKIMGMAASAASIIAMAGDTIEIGAASFIMIHNCEVVAVGNRHDMAETAAGWSRSMPRWSTSTRPHRPEAEGSREVDGCRDLHVGQPRGRARLR